MFISPHVSSQSVEAAPILSAMELPDTQIAVILNSSTQFRLFTFPRFAWLSFARFAWFFTTSRRFLWFLPSLLPRWLYETIDSGFRP